MKKKEKNEKLEDHISKILEFLHLILKPGNIENAEQKLNEIEEKTKKKKVKKLLEKIKVKFEILKVLARNENLKKQESGYSENVNEIIEDMLEELRL